MKSLGKELLSEISVVTSATSIVSVVVGNALGVSVIVVPSKSVAELNAVTSVVDVDVVTTRPSIYSSSSIVVVVVVNVYRETEVEVE